MKKTLLLFNLILTPLIWSQNVAINATGASAATSSALDVDMVNKGVLIPRVALVNTSSFAPVTGTPVTSLLVYNTVASGTIPTNVFHGTYFWKLKVSQKSSSNFQEFYGNVTLMK